MKEYEIFDEDNLRVCTFFMLKIYLIFSVECVNWFLAYKKKNVNWTVDVACWIIWFWLPKNYKTSFLKSKIYLILFYSSSFFIFIFIFIGV